MRPLLLASALLLAPLAALADDPEGTQTLELQVGHTHEVAAPDGSRLQCDDPSVVAADMVDGKLVLRGVAAGTTLCGVRKPGELPGGLYRVKVVQAPEEKKGKKK